MAKPGAAALKAHFLNPALKNIPIKQANIYVYFKCICRVIVVCFMNRKTILSIRVSVQFLLSLFSLAFMC